MRRFLRPISRRALLAALPLLPAAVALVGCENYTDVAAARRRHAKGGKGNIVIGAVRQRDDQSGFVDGVEMAAAEINDGGGLLGRRVSLVVTDDAGGTDSSNANIRNLVENDALVAVISCESTATAIASSVIYEFNDVLCLEVSSTNSRLTAHPFDLIFRTIPDDVYNSGEIADFMMGHGHTRPIIINDRSTYGRDMGILMRGALQQRGGEVTTERTYLSDANSFWKDLDEIKGQDFDSVFLAGYPPAVATFIKVMREIGIQVPIVGGDSLDSRLIWEVAGPAANGLVVPTVFNRDVDDPRVARFVEAFRARRGVPPDTRAAKGYEALKLLATVIGAAKVTDSRIVASIMRYRKGWTGPFSEMSFDRDGGISGRTIYFQRLENGVFGLVKE